MKILVIGDTHGKLNKVRDILPRLTNIDLIAHTGDYSKDGEILYRETGIPVIAVKGNCDGGYGRDNFKIIETEYGKILLTHGHRENVDYDLTRLKYKVMENSCKAVFFGHSHKSLIDETEGIHFVNPGSLTQPRDGSDGSYAIVRTSENSFDASVVFYTTVMGKATKKTKAGFIRNLLNNSDRF